jgi:hypothetical protein
MHFAECLLCNRLSSGRFRCDLIPIMTIRCRPLCANDRHLHSGSLSGSLLEGILAY